MTKLEKDLRAATNQARRLRREMGAVPSVAAGGSSAPAATARPALSADAITAKAFRVRPV